MMNLMMKDATPLQFRIWWIQNIDSTDKTATLKHPGLAKLFHYPKLLRALSGAALQPAWREVKPHNWIVKICNPMANVSQVSAFFHSFALSCMLVVLGRSD